MSTIGKKFYIYKTDPESNLIMCYGVLLFYGKKFSEGGKI
jgi:hypothetical protein